MLCICTGPASRATEAFLAGLVVKGNKLPTFYHRATKVCWLKLKKISGVHKCPIVQVFHEWFPPDSPKTYPLGWLDPLNWPWVWLCERRLCVSCDGLPVQGVFLPFTQWLLGQSPAPTVTLIGTKQQLIEIGWTDGWKSYATGIPPASRRWLSMGYGFGSEAEIAWLRTCMNAEPPHPFPFLRCWGIGCQQTHQLEINVNLLCNHFVLVSSTVFLLNTDLLMCVLIHNLTLILWILVKTASLCSSPHFTFILDSIKYP